MSKLKFMLEKLKRPKPFRTYKDHTAFLSDVPALLDSLLPVEDIKKALPVIRKDKDIFPLRKKGNLLEVSEWIRDTIAADHDYATKELSARSTVTIELRHYHTIKSGLEITTKIHTGEKETGDILWLQIVVKLKDTEYLWWSHN